MPSNIVETATKGSAISAPIGADVRNAASVRTPFQAVGDRLAWLEALVTRLCGTATNIITTALLVPNGTVTLNLGAANLEIIGDDDGNIYLGGVGNSPGGVQMYANGNMASHMFTGGRTGRANRKPDATLTGAGPFNIRPDLYDTFICSGSGAIIVNIDPAGSYVTGEHFRIVNLATSNGYTVAIKSASGTIEHMKIGNGFVNSYGHTRPQTADIMRTAVGGWICTLSDSLA